MFGLDNIFSLASLVRNSYDVVYELGDTSLQFTGDLIRGYDSPRYEAYAHRQIDRHEKRNIPKKPKQSPRAHVQKPLKFEEKRSFAKMMSREPGETIIEHWKRQKQLLAYPDKQNIIASYDTLQEGLKQKEFNQKQVRFEMKNIASKYQKARVPEHKQTQQRGRGR